MNQGMSLLHPGQRCVIIAGCPENIGLIVEVVRRLGSYGGYQDGYEIATVSGRNFGQLWQGKALAKGHSSRAYTERYKLRPLVNPKDDAPAEDVGRKSPVPRHTPAGVL